MNRKVFAAWSLVAAAILFAAMPFVTPFAGFDPMAFPNPQFDPPAQPAGYAFAIWGPIYLVLIVSSLIGAFRHAENETWAKARAFLILSLVIGATWLPIAQINPPAATVLIWLMLITALAALVRTPRNDRLYFRAPVALYTGWLAAASWVSLALVGAGHGIAFGQVGWAIVAIFGATITSLAILVWVPGIPEFGAAAVWALMAISVKDIQSYPDISLLAGVGAMVILVAIIVPSRDVG